MNPTRVLVVDDSAFSRKVIRDVLARDPAIEVVGIARDGLEALEKVNELHPDVVTLDLLMPDLDGVGVLRALPREAAPKVVVVSMAQADSDLAVEALQLGAVDLVSKPTARATDRLYELGDELVAKVKTAARATPRLGAVVQPARDRRPVLLGIERGKAAARLVVIGASTGGPQALTWLFSNLPAGLPFPIAIALHIPSGYTAPMAARLSQIGGVAVEEARDGMELAGGRAVIAPGGMHLRVQAIGGRLVARTSREPVAVLHHPSVNVLFESAAKHVGAAVVGLVLTGMGDDGLVGARAIRSAGGRVLAESAASCVVYGMPRVVIEAGLADAEAPLAALPARLLELAYAEPSPPFTRS
jgi:two-component system, chemotaxis family, protein-glutamate methylesterase/glutaminase